MRAILGQSVNPFVAVTELGGNRALLSSSSSPVVLQTTTAVVVGDDASLKGAHRRPGLVVNQDQVGERPADVDADPLHAGTACRIRSR
jgi:hypothetical protein